MSPLSLTCLLPTEDLPRACTYRAAHSGQHPVTFVVETNLDSSAFFCFLFHGTILNQYNTLYLSQKKKSNKTFSHCYLFKKSDIMDLSAMQFRKEKWILFPPQWWLLDQEWVLRKQKDNCRDPGLCLLELTPQA